MSDTRDDAAIWAIENKIRRTRAPEACDSYEPAAREVLLCVACGWDEPRHKFVAWARKLQAALDAAPKPYNKRKADAIVLLICIGAMALGAGLAYLWRLLF